MRPASSADYGVVPTRWLSTLVVKWLYGSGHAGTPYSVQTDVELAVRSVPVVRGSPHGGASARLTRQPGEGPELRPVRSITWITGTPVNLLVLATMSRPMTFDAPSGLVDRMMASNFPRRTTS